MKPSQTSAHARSASTTATTAASTRASASSRGSSASGGALEHTPPWRAAVSFPWRSLAECTADDDDDRIVFPDLYSKQFCREDDFKM